MNNDTTNYKLMYEYLNLKYKRAVLSKKELCHELGISSGSLDNRIKDGINLPDYIKDKGAKNAPVTFTIISVAQYLSGNDTKTM
jgi:hypothetical protein